MVGDVFKYSESVVEDGARLAAPVEEGTEEEGRGAVCGGELVCGERMEMCVHVCVCTCVCVCVCVCQSS